VKLGLGLLAVVLLFVLAALVTGIVARPVG
jgi:hypothetical protein